MVIAVAPVAAVLLFQDLVAVANLRWYGGLLKPTFSPVPWLAAATSLALAATLASGFFSVLRRPDYLPDRPAAIRVFLLGLALDALWSWLFFAGRHPTVALAAAGALAVVAASAAWHFAIVDRRAGLLLVPWILATSFVFVFDLSIALRNG
jgi:benzodiazapine receptor